MFLDHSMGEERGLENLFVRARIHHKIISSLSVLAHHQQDKKTLRVCAHWPNASTISLLFSSLVAMGHFWLMLSALAFSQRPLRSSEDARMW
jgi:hypothetical protein